MINLENASNKFKEFGIRINTKRTGRYYNAGLLDNIDETFIDEVQSYWLENHHSKVDPGIHVAFMNLYGVKEPRLIPGEQMSKALLPFLNDSKMSIAYRDKNLYDFLFDTEKSVVSVIKRVRGTYYNSDNKIISREEVTPILLDTESEYIIKPSDSNNGLNIEKLIISESKIYLSGNVVTLSDIEKIYKFNFTIQKVIKQHHMMAEPHPASVNTLRMVTLRWKNEIHHLLTFARFGANNLVKDNAGAGGVCVGLSDDGEFFDIAIDQDAKTYIEHPSTGFNFKDLTKIPNFDTFKNYVIKLHEQVIHHDFISWDIAIDENGEPVFIEANFAGATWLYQLACQKPLFGHLSDDIIKTISSHKNKRERNVQVVSQKKRRLNRLNKLKLQLKKKDLEISKLTKELSDNRNEIKKIKSDLNNKNKEFTVIKKQLTDMKNSRSWRYTSIFRKKG